MIFVAKIIIIILILTTKEDEETIYRLLFAKKTTGIYIGIT